MFTSHPKSRHQRIQKQLPFMEVRFPTLRLAFDMTQLQQVIPLPPIAPSQTPLLGLAQVDRGTPEEPDAQPVIVIDLHRKLYDVSLAAPTHLLLFQAGDGLSYGIPVERLPEVTLIAQDLLLSSEDELSHQAAMGITKQVVKISNSLGDKILFIVDADSLAQEVRQLVRSRSITSAA